MTNLILPLLLIFLLITCAFKRLPVYDLFLAGAKQGLSVALQVLPNLAAMLCAISLMEASGLMDQLLRILSPLITMLGLPPETASLILLRPLSGSASLGMLEKLLSRFGADSRIGLISSVVMGSSETIFYTLCVYMSPAKNKNTGYALLCSLLGMLVGTWFAGLIIP